MKVIKQSWSFEENVNGIQILDKIERIGRVCYKSENLINKDSNEDFIKRIIKSGHHSVLEHQSISVRAITDRGVTHEIVRHRIASYSQESTRYCNYSKEKFGKEITAILPVWLYTMEGNYGLYDIWENAMKDAEVNYFKLLEFGWVPQKARTVLPNSLKTELVMTYNIREWRHFFNLRCSSKAHPQMKDLADSMLKGFKQSIPVLFDDIYPEIK